MIGKFLFLGTSASAGIPVVGCQCAVCTSSSPYNKRLRPSGLLEIGGKRLLLDVGPDFRQQALHSHIDHIDGLMITHTHYDHIAGIDELRVFFVRSQREIPCLLSKESFEELRIRYHYFFRPRDHGPSLSAQLDFQILEHDLGETQFLGIPLRYMSYFQGGMKVNGFRFGDFAYVSDIREYDDTVFAALHGVQTLVLSALREAPSPLHLSLSEAIQFAQKVGAKKTWLTHISHSVDHETINAKLPANIQLAYDGLEMEFQIG